MRSKELISLLWLRLGMPVASNRSQSLLDLPAKKPLISTGNSLLCFRTGLLRLFLSNVQSIDDLLSLYKGKGMLWLRVMVGLCGLLHPYLRSTTLGHGNDVRRVEWPLSLQLHHTI